MRHITTITVLAIFSFLASSTLAAPDVGKELEQLTAAHTRLAWVQDAGDNRDTMAAGKNLKLMGLDSRDGRGERAILSDARSCYKPLITPDGDRVIFSDRHAAQVYIVNWDGTGLRALLKGVAADVWADPINGDEWVYVRADANNNRSPIHRYLIDDPSRSELVWDKTPVDIDNFQLSADGTRAAGLFPWPEAGVAMLPNKSWSRIGGGCWTSMAPDNSYMTWIFDGPHRGVELKRPDRSLVVDIHNAPGIDRWEVYHPRWSNHVGFITMTGPYKSGGMGANNIGAGGPAVELYLGRFNDAFTSIEKWVRVTHNIRGDFHGDAWIQGGEKVSAKAMLAEAEEKVLASVSREVTPQSAWPGDMANLEFLWESANATNQIEDTENNVSRACRIEARDKARFGRHGQLLLTGGAAVAEDASKVLVEACRKSNQLSIEAVLTSANISQGGPARIVTLSSDMMNRNFTLGQEKDRLVLRLRTPQTGANGMNPETTICKIEAGKTYHVIISYFPGRLFGYVNGQKVLETEAVKGDLSNWDPNHHLLFGDEHDRQRDWHGELEGVAIYSRFISPKEAAMKYELIAPRLEKRQPATQVIVEGRLVETSTTPDPESLDAYRRCLVMYTYDVQRVIQGQTDAKRIAVAHWAILDRQVQREIANRKPGQVVRLVLENFADHPELTGERRIEETSDLSLPAFFDVGQ